MLYMLQKVLIRFQCSPRIWLHIANSYFLIILTLTVLTIFESQFLIYLHGHVDHFVITVCALY